MESKMKLSRKVATLGVDIGSNSIKVVELGHGSKGPFIINAGMTESLADSSVEAASAALAQLIERRKFRSKRTSAVVQTASEGSATVRRIFMEHVTADIKEAELKERVKWEVVTRDYIPFPAEEAIIECHVLEEGTQENIPGLWVFLVAIRREMVTDRINMLRAAGLVPIAIEIDFSAVLGLLSYMGLFPDDEDVAVIDIGATKTSIGIIYRRQLVFYRDISVAGNHITSQIERRLRIKKQEAEDYKLTEELFEKVSNGTGDIWRAASPIESVIEERQGLYPQIRECFRYYEGDVPNARLSRVFFSGGTSQLHNLDDFLSQRLAIPVENVHFLDHIPVAHDGDIDEIEGKEPMFAAAVGLALKPFRQSSNQ
jgi:type IV pilus assembly protein PilM